uniref:Uncharacterized protein n=1 Tax=Alexandrium monilatum TaxID=311494 RepID=A0A7S4T8M5_9DINO
MGALLADPQDVPRARSPDCVRQQGVEDLRREEAAGGVLEVHVERGGGGDLLVHGGGAGEEVREAVAVGAGDEVHERAAADRLHSLHAPVGRKEVGHFARWVPDRQGGGQVQLGVA